jgi:phosphatidylglycerol:prolipoprotein diacylglycerol transferase
MYPEIFRIGNFPVSSFGLMLVCAFVAAYFQLAWGLKRLNAGDEEDASALLFAAGLAGIVGSKVYYAILYGDWRLLFDRSGLVWYGGFLLGTLAVIFVLRRRHLPPWRTADAVAPALALGYGIGRIGCFLVGDDYGVPTSLPWGVEFARGLPPTYAGSLRAFGVAVPADIPDTKLLAVHPTQLYETALAVLIWWIGIRALKRQMDRRGRAGTTALLVIALLAVERFLIELLRAKDDRLLGMFTIAQAISVAVLAAIVILWISRSRNRGEAVAGASARGSR